MQVQLVAYEGTNQISVTSNIFLLKYTKNDNSWMTRTVNIKIHVRSTLYQHIYSQALIGLTTNTGCNDKSQWRGLID